MGEGAPAGAGPPVRERVLTHVTAFVRDLRRAGVDVPANAGIDATRALAVVGVDDAWRARAATRATLLTRPRDGESFDRLFPRFWAGLTAALEADQAERDPADAPARADADGPASPDGEEEAGGEADGTDGEELAGDDQSSVTGTPSGRDRTGRGSTGDSPNGHGAVTDDASNGGDGEAVERASYSRSGDGEAVGGIGAGAAAGLADAVADLTEALSGIEGRRYRHTPSGDHLDTRRALRRSFSTGGTVLELPRRERRPARVRGVALVDVSRSVLDTLDRGFLVRFLATLRSAWPAVRIFFFDTDLREVTEAFQAPSAAGAVAALGRAETEWGGGTRIGESLATLRADHPHAVDRRTTVLLVSDGLEVGDVSGLEAEVATLARRADRLLWLNPLAAAANYEPTCRGMAAALPYVDGLFGFAGPADLVEMARQLRLRGPGGRIGHEYAGTYRADRAPGLDPSPVRDNS